MKRWLQLTGIVLLIGAMAGLAHPDSRNENTSKPEKVRKHHKGTPSKSKTKRFEKIDNHQATSARTSTHD